jgi:DNA-directed RNA polymerase specialized sigma24 family protein
MGDIYTSVTRGAVGFDEFARATRAHWGAIARKLHRKWKVPAWLGAEDIEQELLLAAWVSAPRFDPARGHTAKAYLVFHACDKAKKAIHKARGSYRRDGNAPSRIETPVGDTTAERFTANRFAVGVDEALEGAARARELAECHPGHDRALASLGATTGHPAGAVRWLCTRWAVDSVQAHREVMAAVRAILTLPPTPPAWLFAQVA